MTDVPIAPDARRASILANVRRRLGGSDGDGRAEAVRDRIESHPRGVVPGRASGDNAALVKLFAEMIGASGATVATVESEADVPAAISDYLRDTNLPAHLRRGSDGMLAGLPWGETPSLDVVEGPAEAEDAVSLTHALAAAAETGTLILASGPDNPTTLNYLPDTNIVLIRQADIVGSYEDCWDRVRAIYGPGNLPRTINWISGPSRTADIEQTIVMGAHGPRRLHVVIVKG